jgi:hypothetical protein
MSEMEDCLPLSLEAIRTAMNTGRLSEQDWQALDRRLQLAVFETVAGRPPPRYGSLRASSSAIKVRRTM